MGLVYEHFVTHRHCPPTEEWNVSCETEAERGRGGILGLPCCANLIKFQSRQLPWLLLSHTRHCDNRYYQACTLPSIVHCVHCLQGCCYLKIPRKSLFEWTRNRVQEESPSQQKFKLISINQPPVSTRLLFAFRRLFFCLFFVFFGAMFLGQSFINRKLTSLLRVTHW